MTESPIYQKSWKKGIKTLAIVYPNLYYGGVYCLGPLIIYNIVNQKEGWLCERQFLDKNNLKNFDFIGFTFQYELDYYNFFKILKENNIPLKKPRKQIIFAGGPCINTNYKPLSAYIDFFIMGECEEVLPKVLDNYGKKDFLEEISKIQGVFVPGISKETSTAIIEDLDKVSYPLIQPFPEEIDKSFVFGKVFMLETERGCPFSCHFCPISQIHKKTKYRSLESIKEIIDKGIAINKRDKVVIYSPSFSHPKRKEILKYLIEKNLRFSIPSIKVETIDEELLTLIKKGGQKTLTIAPECNESLRPSLNKPIPDEKFFQFVELANKLNFETIKLYFMIGLPNQTQKDLEEMIIFIRKVKNLFKKRTYISINPFVPKPKTAFSQHKFDKKTVKQQAIYIKKELNKIGIKYKIPNINTSYLEWKLAFSNGLKKTH